jgi:hypothetical protein
MRLRNLLILLEDIENREGDLDVRAGLKGSSDSVTGVWVEQDLNSQNSRLFVILATPNKEKKWLQTST